MHVCVLIHGVELSAKGFSWMVGMELILQSRMPDINLISRKYGTVTKWRTVFPWYRKRWVDEQRDYFNLLQGYVGRNGKISVFAHSFGPYIISKLLPDFKFHNLIFMMGAADENLDWSKVDKNFNRVLNVWSPNDETLPRSPYGQMGLVGHKVFHPRVMSIKTNWTHNEFQDDAKIYTNANGWIDFLRS